MLALSNQGISAAESLQERLAGKSVEVKFEKIEPVEVKVRSFNPYRRIVDEILTGKIEESVCLLNRLKEIDQGSTQEQLYLTSRLVLELAQKEVADMVYNEFTDGIVEGRSITDLVESLKLAADYLDENQLLSLRSFLGNEIDGCVNRRTLGDLRYG